MMLRWEQLHPVNAVHVTWLRHSIPAARIETAAERVFERLLKGLQLPAEGNGGDPLRPFEFQHIAFGGDWRGHLELAVTGELNAAFERGRTPFRIRVIDVGDHGQFLILAYRHVVADARAIALLQIELIGQLTDPETQNSNMRAVVGGLGLRQLFPAEFRWRRLPALACHLAGEWWKSQRCVRLQAIDPDDLRMEFRLHQAALPLNVLKHRCHRLGATVNDLLVASVLEWFASWISDRQGGRSDFGVATLVDLSCRGKTAQPRAFGQFLSQFAVRAPVTADLSFEDIVRLVSRQTASHKQVHPLIYNSIGFELLSRLWDLLPLIRKPRHLPTRLPLLAGISNVNLSGVLGGNEMPSIVRNYFRGTCVTNLLPLMLSLTSLQDTVSITTTHRPVFFSTEQMDDLAAHVGRRLFDGAVDSECSRIPRRAA